MKYFNARCKLHRPVFMTLEPIRWQLRSWELRVFLTDDFASYLVNKCQIWLIFCLKSHFLKMKMASTIAAANWCEWFLKTIPKILRTFFTDTLETHQFAAVEFTLNQRLLTKVNCSCLDKAQNLPVEKIINANFFPLEFVNGVQIDRSGGHTTNKHLLVL